jgi:hypothetical protein
MEKISLTDRVEERNILHTIRRRKTNWTGHVLRRNYLLKHIIEGKIRGTRRRGRRCKQLLDNLKEASRYWKLKEEAQDRTFGELNLDEAIYLSQDKLLVLPESRSRDSVVGIATSYGLDD